MILNYFVKQSEFKINYIINNFEHYNFCNLI